MNHAFLNRMETSLERVLPGVRALKILVFFVIDLQGTPCAIILRLTINPLGYIDDKQALSFGGMKRIAHAKKAIRLSVLRFTEAQQSMGHAKLRLREAAKAIDKIRIEIAGNPPIVEEISVSGLSPRQRQILGMFAGGKHYKAIAHELHISPETVKVHRRHIIQRLKVKDIATLTRIAIQNQLISLH